MLEEVNKLQEEVDLKSLGYLPNPNDIEIQRTQSKW